MKFEQVPLQSCADVTGVVVVIDVIRAFTTAAFAFAAGAETITLVSTVDEAVELRHQHPKALVMGEVHGLPPAEFDLGNSPFALRGVDLAGRHLIQRTSAGTQGVVRSKRAGRLLASSLCCAQATAQFITTLAPDKVTFVVTGLGPDGQGEEDVACAEYLAALLQGSKADPDLYAKRVRECSTSQRLFANPSKPEFRWEDIECCVSVDRFDFPMIIERQNGLSVMRPYRLPQPVSNQPS